jgi:hypothetical protein
MNFVRAHALAHAAEMGCDIETAALRVFSNAEGAYGSNVNATGGQLAFGDEDELADAYQAASPLPTAQRQGRAHGRCCSGAKGGRCRLPEPRIRRTGRHHGRPLLRHAGRHRPRGETRPRRSRPRSTSATRRAAPPKCAPSGPDRAGDPLAQPQPQASTRAPEARPRGRAPDRGAADQHDGLVGDDRSGRPWVYQRLSETFVLDAAMRKRLAALNPQASVPGWRTACSRPRTAPTGQPDAATLAALRTRPTNSRIAWKGSRRNDPAKPAPETMSPLLKDRTPPVPTARCGTGPGNGMSPRDEIPEPQGVRTAKARCRCTRTPLKIEGAKVFSVYGKGGIGKSTTSSNLSAPSR